ncbi:signal peptidase I [bacterium]|nr:signal peptidase I [bacterium]
MKGFFSIIAEVVQIFLIALAIVIPIRYFLFQPFFVSGASMEPNFDSGEYLLIDEISYRFREPQRGEVIVFRSPTDPSKYFIKRIIGLPGETVEIKEGKIKIYNLDFPEGKTLKESYIENEKTGGNIKISLKKNEYFVLGDNRNHSSDSRSWGPVPRKNIIGRAWLSVHFPKGIHLLASPQY